jgi:hypothetical protein
LLFFGGNNSPKNSVRKKELVEIFEIKENGRAENE